MARELVGESQTPHAHCHVTEEHLVRENVVCRWLVRSGVSSVSARTDSPRILNGDKPKSRADDFYLGKITLFACVHKYE